MIEAIKKAKAEYINNGGLPSELWIGTQGYLYMSDEIKTHARGEIWILDTICGLPVVCDSDIPEGRFYIR